MQDEPESMGVALHELGDSREQEEEGKHRNITWWKTTGVGAMGRQRGVVDWETEGATSFDHDQSEGARAQPLDKDDDRTQPPLITPVMEE